MARVFSTWKMAWNFLCVGLSLHQATYCVSHQMEEWSQSFNSKEENIGDHRTQRLALFTQVKFENYACRALNGFQGTCILDKECRSLGGQAQGSCALSFGVCCYFESGCGATTSLNNSYFVGPSTLGTGTGSCQYTINKSAPNVCQIRLDFDEFNLAQPTLATGECANDKMTIVGGIRGVPTLCGTNDGQHVYLHTGPSNSPVTVNINAARNFAGRRWRIRSTQICCDSVVTAPEGCLQYFTEVTGMIRSFNYLPDNRGLHLNNQFYSICIRPHYRFCSICYSQCGSAPSGSFSLAHELNGRFTSLTDDLCTTDFLVIPCAQADTAPLGNCAVNSLCGGALNVGIAEDPAPVCSSVRPFRLTFKTDANEELAFMGAMPDVNSNGFCLNYIQNPC